jgi:hypothetical protein
MIHMNRLRILILITGFIAAFPMLAAQPAFDNASDPVYGDGWNAGDNGGFGFGPWTFSPDSEVSIGTSTANGDVQPPTGDIDSDGHRAWTLSKPTVRNTFVSTASRPLNGSLSVGETISFDVDGQIPAPNLGFMYVSLGNPTNNRWRMEFRPTAIGAGNGEGFDALIIPGTAEGVHVEFTLTGVDSYSVTLNVLGDVQQYATGTLAGPAGSDIDRVQFENIPAVSLDFFANNLTVTPEPNSACLVLCAVVAQLARRGRASRPA